MADLRCSLAQRKVADGQQPEHLAAAATTTRLMSQSHVRTSIP
jgi:hypothetical protein